MHGTGQAQFGILVVEFVTRTVFGEEVIKSIGRIRHQIDDHVRIISIASAFAVTLLLVASIGFLGITAEGADITGTNAELSF